MKSLFVHGGTALNGTVRIQGSKNAVLPMMAAAILHNGIVTLKNCPRISDVFFMVEILKSLGAHIVWEGHTLSIDGRNLHSFCIPSIYGVQMRSSMILLGSLLGRMGRCEMSYPGGCVIGKRPIDIHIDGLHNMGVEIEEEDECIRAFAGKLYGCIYTFPQKSVGATENMILAAVLADGKTYLYGCATEPEIVWLCHLLVKMGAKIRGIGTENLMIEGVKTLKNAEFEVPPDRIVAGTYLLAGAITRGKVVLENAPIEEMAGILKAYEKMGGQYEYSSGKLITDSGQISNPLLFIETEVYPGLPTDLQSQLMAVLATVDGESMIRENVFEDRFKIVSELERMGARIAIEGKDAHISGGFPLKGAHVYARELRGGAALVLAALAAEGVSCIGNYHYIERGYEDICRDITALGGHIRKDEEDKSDEKIQRI